MGRFSEGELIELREVWDGRTWEVRQAIVVRDTPELIATYTPPLSPASVAIGIDGQRLRLPTVDWRLEETQTWEKPVLGLHTPGDAYSILVIWDQHFTLEYWYINLESDLSRTVTGFEYEDRWLDVVVQPGMSSWRWKDEDELAEAVLSGLITKAEAAAIRAEGERALQRVLKRQPPLGEPWEDWRPNPAWPLRPSRR